MVLVGRPMEGAQPTSLTQSLWASSFWSSFHWPSSSLEAGSEHQWWLSLEPSFRVFIVQNNNFLTGTHDVKKIKIYIYLYTNLYTLSIKTRCLHCPQCNFTTWTQTRFISGAVGSILIHTFPTACICIKEKLTSRVWPDCRSLQRQSVWHSLVSVPTAGRSGCPEPRQEPNSLRYSQSDGCLQGN